MYDVMFMQDGKGRGRKCRCLVYVQEVGGILET